MDLNSNIQGLKFQTDRPASGLFFHMHWSVRLNKRLTALDWTMAKLANESGIPYDSINKYCRGEVDQPRGDAMGKLARTLGVSLRWLRDGEGSDAIANGGAQNVSNSATRQIPLIDYVAAGQWREVADPYEVGDGVELVSVDKGKDIGPRAFALTVDGESMIATSPLERRSFQPGDTIIVDPDQALQPGCFVVAKIGGEEAATFKKYRPRGTDVDGTEIIDLVPLNEDYPTIRLDAQHPGHIIGRVIRRIENL